jgi:hypothetical protein
MSRTVVLAAGTALGMLLTSSCALFNATAESVVSVRGTLKGQTGEQLHSCKLALIRTDTGKLAREREIAPQFEDTFTIAPGFHEYYFSIDCVGWLPARTKAYELGGTRYAQQPLDLGVISLAPKHE